MTQQRPSGEEFVDGWLEGQARVDELDQKVLSLIDQYRDGADLDEDGLLTALIAVSESGGGENAES